MTLKDENGLDILNVNQNWYYENNSLSHIKSSDKPSISNPKYIRKYFSFYTFFYFVHANVSRSIRPWLEPPRAVLTINNTANSQL